MSKWRYTGEQPVIYPDRQNVDGTTLAVEPGGVYELDEAPDGDFEAVAEEPGPWDVAAAPDAVAAPQDEVKPEEGQPDA